jgi:hypothetical protein
MCSFYLFPRRVPVYMGSTDDVNDYLGYVAKYKQ